MLHLTNDRPNCSALLLLSTFFVSCWAYYMRVGIQVYLFGWKITVNVFLFNVYKRFLIFVTFLTFFNVFFILGNVFFIYGWNCGRHVGRPNRRLLHVEYPQSFTTPSRIFLFLDKNCAFFTVFRVRQLQWWASRRWRWRVTNCYWKINLIWFDIVSRFDRAWLWTSDSCTSNLRTIPRGKNWATGFINQSIDRSIIYCS